MRKGFGEFAVTLGGRSCALIAGAATQSILAWQLGAQGRGSLAVCLVFAAVLGLLFSVGTEVGGLYFMSSGRLGVWETLFYVSAFAGCSSLLAVGAGYALIHTSFSFFAKATHEAFLLSLVLVPVTMFSDKFLNLLTGVRLFKEFAAITVLRSIVQMLLTILFVWWMKQDVGGALLASIATATMVFVLSAAVFLRNFEFSRFRPSFSNFVAMFSYGCRYYLGKISNLANVEMGTVIIAFFADRAEIGWFALASRVTKLVQMIPEALTTTLFPRIAVNREGTRDLVMRTARAAGAVSAAVLFTLALVAKPMVAIVFSPDFLPAVSLIRILVIGGVFYCMAKVFLSYLVAANRPGIASITVTIGVMVNLGLLWLLLPRIGISAAAWAVTGSYLVDSAILFFLFRQYSGARFREMFAFSRNDWAGLPRLFRRKTSKVAEDA